MGAQIKSNASLRTTLAFFGCNPRSCVELCEVFDWDESGYLTAEDLLSGCGKLFDERQAFWNFFATRAIANGLKRQILRLCDAFARSKLEAECKCKAIDDVQATQDVVLSEIRCRVASRSQIGMS